MSTPSSPLPPPPPEPRPYGHKSPGLAVLFSLLPGLGHIYLGLYQRGVAFFAAFLAALWLADHADLSGALVAFVFFFTMFDAHRMATLLAAAAPGTPLVSAPQSTFGKGNLTMGVVLLLAGAVLLYSNFYPLDLSFLADWWPLGLILFGLWLVVRDLRGKTAKENLQDGPTV
ncbi:MAG: LiaI-LiaF-like domain-containing protein [Acidobacteriota bacterium]